METRPSPDRRDTAFSAAARRAADPSLLSERLGLLPTDRLPSEAQSPQLYAFLRDDVSDWGGCASEILDWLSGIGRSDRMAGLQKHFPQLVPGVVMSRWAQAKPALDGLRIKLDLDDDPGGWGAPQHPLANRRCVICGVQVRMSCTDGQAKALTRLLAGRGRELESVIVIAYPREADRQAAFLDGLKTVAGLTSLSMSWLAPALDHGGLISAFDALLNGGNLRSLSLTTTDEQGLDLLARRVAAHLPRCGLDKLGIDVTHRAPKAAALKALALLARRGNGLRILGLMRWGSPWKLKIADVLPLLREPCDLFVLLTSADAIDRRELVHCHIDACLERNRQMPEGSLRGPRALAAIVSRTVDLHLSRERCVRGRIVDVMLQLQRELATALAAQAIDHGQVVALLVADLRRVMTDLQARLAQGLPPVAIAPAAPAAAGATPTAVVVQRWLGPGLILIDDDEEPVSCGSQALFVDLAVIVADVLEEIPEFAHDVPGYGALCDNVLERYLRERYLGLTTPALH